MLAPATTALAQAVPETRGGRRRLRRGRRNRWPLPRDRPGNSKFRRRGRRPRPFGAALLGRFLPRLKALASCRGLFPGIMCITGFWPISPSLPGKFPRAHSDRRCLATRDYIAGNDKRARCPPCHFAAFLGAIARASHSGRRKTGQVFARRLAKRKAVLV